MTNDLGAELIASILRDQEIASVEAHRLARLRDDVDVRLRFGLAVFNSASLVALLWAIRRRFRLFGFRRVHFGAEGLLPERIRRWNCVGGNFGILNPR